MLHCLPDHGHTDGNVVVVGILAQQRLDAQLVGLGVLQQHESRIGLWKDLEQRLQDRRQNFFQIHHAAEFRIDFQNGAQLDLWANIFAIQLQAELKHVVADANPIPVPQWGTAVDTDSVDFGPAQSPQVFDEESAVLLDDLSVMTADRDVIVCVAVIQRMNLLISPSSFGRKTKCQ